MLDFEKSDYYRKICDEEALRGERTAYYFRWVLIGAVTIASISLITDKSEFMAGICALALLSIALVYNLAMTFVMRRESWIKRGLICYVSVTIDISLVTCFYLLVSIFQNPEAVASAVIMFLYPTLIFLAALRNKKGLIIFATTLVVVLNNACFFARFHVIPSDLVERVYMLDLRGQLLKSIYILIFGFFILRIPSVILRLLTRQNEMFGELQKSLELQTELAKESQRRLKITEIYTRHSIVEAIEDNKDPTQFVPTKRYISILFSDIRNFTRISEAMNPMEIVSLLNGYFDEMNEHIARRGGEIDKLIGDSIMALFYDADSALQAAIEMRRGLKALNGRCQDGPCIESGIGINYGEVVLGNIGSKTKMDYTVIGDIVNSASRLEGLTKYYGLPLLISGELKEVLKDSYRTRFVDQVIVKGRKHAMRIFEVLDHEDDRIIRDRLEASETYGGAYALYSGGDFIAALDAFSDLARRERATGRTPDPLLKFYRDRCEMLSAQKKTGTLTEWDGTFEFLEK